MIEAGTTCIRFNDIDSNEILDRFDTTEKGPLTLKFDTKTWPFLKIDMRHRAYRQEGNYKQHDMLFLKIDMQHGSIL